jgi:hypothetical protein
MERHGIERIDVGAFHDIYKKLRLVHTWARARASSVLPFTCLFLHCRANLPQTSR